MLKKLLSSFRKKRRLGVIFVEYDRPACGGSEQVFATLQRYLGDVHGWQTTYLRVDNKNEGAALNKVSKAVYRVGGDNSFREFSGWQKGASAIQQITQAPEMLLLVNDMFLKPGESFLRDYDTNKLLERSFNGNKV